MGLRYRYRIFLTGVVVKSPGSLHKLGTASEFRYSQEFCLTKDDEADVSGLLRLAHEI